MSKKPLLEERTGDIDLLDASESRQSHFFDGSRLVVRPHYAKGFQDDNTSCAPSAPVEPVCAGSRVESRDCTPFESAIARARDGLSLRGLKCESAATWAMTFFIGVVVAVFGSAVSFGVLMLSNLKLDMVLTEDKAIPQEKIWSGFATLLAWNMGLIAFATILCSFEPNACGSGIAEVKAVLNGLNIKRMMRIKTLLFKMLGLICVCAAGLPLGKEGPMIHIGGIIGAGFSQGKSSYLGFDLSFTKFSAFRNDVAKRDFISCGAAAGVAAAFGAPISGVLFWLEEGASFWSQQLTLRVFVSSIVAATFVSLILALVYEYFDIKVEGGSSIPGMLSFGDFSNDRSNTLYTLKELPLMLGLGVLGGLLGVVFNELNIRLVRWRIKAYQRQGLPRKIVETLLAAFFYTSLSYVIPLFKPTCVSLAHGNETMVDEFFRGRCPAGQYSELGTLFLSTNESTIKILFHSSHSFQLLSLLSFFILCYLSAVWACGTAIPGGLLAPMFLMGSVVGRLYFKLLAMVVGAGFLSNVTTYALVGAGAMVGGLARINITTTVLLIELTGDIQFALPLLLSLLVCKLVADPFAPGHYETLSAQRGYPTLEADVPHEATFLTVRDVMNPRVRVLRCVCTVREVVEALKDLGKSGISANAIAVVGCQKLAKNVPRNLPAHRPEAEEEAWVKAGDSNAAGGEAALIGREQASPGAAERVSPASMPRFLSPTSSLPLPQSGSLSSILKANEGASSFPEPPALGAGGGRLGGGEQGPASAPEAFLSSAGHARAAASTTATATATATAVAAGSVANTRDEADTGCLGSAEGPREMSRKKRGAVAFSGYVLGHHLTSLLSFRTFTSWHPLRSEGRLGEEAPVLTWHQMESRYPRYPSLRDAVAGLSVEDYECWLDLTPYIHPTPLTVLHYTPLAQAYWVFRTLGLRHLFVLNRDQTVGGLITRKSLTEHWQKVKLKERKVHLGPDLGETPSLYINTPQALRRNSRDRNSYQDLRAAAKEAGASGGIVTRRARNANAHSARAAPN